MMRYATIKQIEIIGEAANLISDITRQESRKLNGNRSSDFAMYWYMNISVLTVNWYGK
jgi:uncharacterized protein with HEPN domain